MSRARAFLVLGLVLVAGESHGAPSQARRTALELVEHDVDVAIEDEVDDSDDADYDQSAPAPNVVLPPRAVRRAPVYRPSDVFWRPKERADISRP